MTKRVPMLPVALAGVVALALSAPVFAAEGAPAPAKAPAASIKLDFGAGRRVHIACGDAGLQACIEAATPMIDKVASTPVAKDRMGRYHRKGPKADARRGKGAAGAAAAPPAGDAATAP